MNQPRGQRSISKERCSYPAQGRYRPAREADWFVVREENGSEVTRSLRREVAEMYLRGPR